MSLNIMHLSIFGITYVKNINLLENIKEIIYIQSQLRDDELFSPRFDEKENEWLLKSNFYTMIENIEFKFVLNDNMDIWVRMRNKSDIEDNKDEIRSIYFFEECSNNFLKHHSQEKWYIESHLIDLVLENLAK